MNQGVAGKLTVYEEPQVSFLVLDYLRPQAARVCLESIRRHVKLNHYRIIYLHNGQADYPHDLLREGLIDELIMPRVNGGLGLGTRALFAACFSPYAIYWQVDQVMGRDFRQDELAALIDLDDQTVRAPGVNHRMIRSISLAGAPCGPETYSERAHFIETRAYKQWEMLDRLSVGGAGPYHHLPWREGEMQERYRENDYIHWTNWPPLAIDNGRDAVRQNPDGSVWRHEPDTKRAWLVSGPVRDTYVYPKLSPREWSEVIATQVWPEGKIPEDEVKDSFTVPRWHSTP